MRIKRKVKEQFKQGDFKTRVVYLWFPLTINNEMRWLEFAKIKYIYMDHDSFFESENWHPIEWLPYDPLTDCAKYKKDGCVHVDGLLCDIEKCNLKNDFKNLDIEEKNIKPNSKSIF